MTTRLLGCKVLFLSKSAPMASFSGVGFRDTSYFGRPEWMINFRVADLVAMVTQVRDAGLKVTADPKR